MIKIRYRDPNELSPGLHAEAERRGRCTTVYLLSGLTKRERRAALRRLRLSARMGYCPSLPAPQLALALLKDRIRTGAGQTGAVFRLHPAGSTVPIMVLSGGAIAFLLLSTVSIRVLHKTPGDLATGGTPPITAASALPNPAGSSQGQAGSGLGNQGVVSSPAADIGPGYAGSAVNPVGSVGQGANGSVNPGGTGTGNTGTGSSDPGSGSTITGPGSSATGSGQSGSSGTGTSGTGSNSTGSSGNGGSSESSGSTKSSSGTSSSGSGTSGSSGSSSTGAGATTPASTAPAPAATSSSSSSNSGGGVCLDVGPLGVCLDV
jgi:hypothetical protein